MNDALITAGYRECARITREFGTTYYWGTILLPPEQRRHVHAVYALCRLADDIVDAPGATSDPSRIAATEASLTAYADRFRARVTGLGPGDGRGGGLEDGRGDGRERSPGRVTTTGVAAYPDADPVLAAIAHTTRATAIDAECFDRFFAAMRRDLTQTTYETWDDLLDYMDGSAAVIGEMMLPVLRPNGSVGGSRRGNRVGASHGPIRESARALGLAFQLTNFLRDVGEDLDRGRVYLPQDELRAAGADPWLRRVTPQWRAFMRGQIERNRELYRIADTGIDLLPPASARCVATARVLYARILDLIEANDYDVFGARVRVPTWRKAVLCARTAALGPASLGGAA